MSTVILKRSIRKKRTQTVEVKPELRALKCDSCEKLFQMGAFCNDQHLAEMSGTFDKVATTKLGSGRGNTFSAIVCSFACADEIFNGGWKRLSLYGDHHVRCGCELVRASLKITKYVREEAELVEEWGEMEERERGPSLRGVGQAKLPFKLD